MNLINNNTMKKDIFITILSILFSVSSVSAQGFLKKVTDTAKKLTTTEQSVANNTTETTPDYIAPVEFSIESTRIIGDQILISGKMRSIEDLRLMLKDITVITPDGDTYEVKHIWWGGEIGTLMLFDKNLTADINYSMDISIDVKGRAVNGFTVLTIGAFNHTAQQKFTIPIRNIEIPSPADPNLADPSVIEIDKNVYLRWTKAEETTTSLKISFVVENKGNKDVQIQFISNKMKLIDSDGSAYEATTTLTGRIDFPSGIPIAGSINLNKPLKVNQISLVEFASRNFIYKLRKIVVP